MEREKLVVAYLNSELSKAEQKAFESELRGSPELQKLVAEQKLILQALKAQEEAEPRSGFEDRFWERVKLAQSLTRRPVGQSLLERLFPANVARAVAAIGVCVMLMVVVVNLQQPQTPSDREKPSEIRDVIAIENGGGSPEEAIFVNYQAASLERQYDRQEF